MNAPQAFYLVRRELARARNRFAPMNSPHEGFAVLQEETDELWDAVKRGDMASMREEALQVAAMALRFLIDCVDGTDVDGPPATDTAGNEDPD